MTHSFKAHYFHLVWSTKNRKRIIKKDIQSNLYSYIGGIIKKRNGILLSAGGTDNHIHLLVSLKLPDQFSELVRDVKANSSLWINKNSNNQKRFAWQQGYSSFSVSYSGLAKVQLYIENQEEHHKIITFEEEFRRILIKHQIKIDSRFVFD